MAGGTHGTQVAPAGGGPRLAPPPERQTVTGAQFYATLLYSTLLYSTLLYSTILYTPSLPT